MSILDALPHSCTVERRSRIADGLGGSRDSFSSSGTLSCWRQVANDREIREFDKRGISITDKVYFTSDPGINETCRLIFPDGTYEVRSFAAPDASAGKGVVWRVMVERTTTTE